MPPQSFDASYAPGGNLSSWMAKCYCIQLGKESGQQPCNFTLKNCDNVFYEFLTVPHGASQKKKSSYWTWGAILLETDSDWLYLPSWCKNHPSGSQTGELVSRRWHEYQDRWLWFGHNCTKWQRKKTVNCFCSDWTRIGMQFSLPWTLNVIYSINNQLIWIFVSILEHCVALLTTSLQRFWARKVTVSKLMFGRLVVLCK